MCGLENPKQFSLSVGEIRNVYPSEQYSRQWLAIAVTNQPRHPI